MNCADLIIVISVILLWASIGYCVFIKSKNKGYCNQCSYGKKNDLVKQYYKNKCRGIKKKI